MRYTVHLYGDVPKVGSAESYPAIRDVSSIKLIVLDNIIHKYFAVYHVVVYIASF